MDPLFDPAHKKINFMLHLFHEIYWAFRNPAT